METFLNQLEVFFKTDGILAVQVIFTAVGGVLLTNFLCGLLNRMVERSEHIESANAHFVLTILKVAMLVTVFVLVAVELGVSPASIMAELSIISAVVTLSLKDTIASLANGVMIVSTKPFVQGDHVIVGGVDGVVKSIHLFSTVLTTFDNQVVTVPNQSVINGTITNYSRMPTRRIAVVASVCYGADVDQVKRVLSGVVQSTPHVLKQPAPFIRMTCMGASSIDFTIRVWAYTEYYGSVLFDLNEGVYKALNAAGIEIPFPQMDVHLRDVPETMHLSMETALADAPETAPGEEGTHA